jgi:hypothetical protein
MNTPLESTGAAAGVADAGVAGTGAPVLPLQLLQPLDASHPLSSPASLGGPEQRLIVSPDPGVGVELDLRPTRLLISREGQTRSIWPVHLAGWQALGWELLTPAEATEVMQDPAPAAIEPAPAAECLPTPGEALLAGEEPNFQAMTKAEITAFCAQTFGVNVDGAMTKAELVATATGLHQEAAVGEAPADAEFPDDLL